MSRGFSGAKQIIKAADECKKSRSSLFTLSKQDDDLIVYQSTFRVSTTFTSLLFAVRTATVATASKEGTMFTFTHNLPLSY